MENKDDDDDDDDDESRCETAEVSKYLYFSLCISFRLAGLHRSHYSGLLVKKIMICI
jgi:hypothetical protein